MINTIERFSIPLILCFLLLVGACADPFTTSKHTFGLESIVLANESEKHSSFFLIAGGGDFGKKGYYYFYVKNPDGTVGLEKRKNDNLLFKEVEGKSSITCESYSDSDKKIRFNEYEQYNCVATVPPGSIGSAIDINLKNVK